jgi:hypothetical protein
MAELTRQEVLRVLADGKEVELSNKLREDWVSLVYGCYDALHTGCFNNYKWRIKPEPPKWYENISEQGILCWYGDKYHNLPTDSKCITVITRYFSGEGKPFMSSSGFRHENCIPLTNEEIKQFLRGE